MERYETGIEIGTYLHNISDEEEVSRTEELSALNNNFIRVKARSENGEVIDAVVFRILERQKLRFRDTPIANMMIGRMIQSRWVQQAYCNECGIPIHAIDTAIFSGGKTYCMKCGSEKYSEPVDEYTDEEDPYVCTRCGSEIEAGDDIWSFYDDTENQDDYSMCSKCAYITHRFPLWENWYKET